MLFINIEYKYRYTFEITIININLQDINVGNQFSIFCNVRYKIATSPDLIRKFGILATYLQIIDRYAISEYESLEKNKFVGKN